MKIAVIGASGTIGSAIARAVTAAGHELAAGSRRDGVDAATGAGVTRVVDGATVLIDASNAAKAEEAAATEYFIAATRNLTTAARAAGVGHYLAISIVGTDDLQDSGYFRAKLAQERAVSEGGVPFTIVRVTQVFEFIPTLISLAGAADPIRMPSQAMQPLSADDVGAAILAMIDQPPANGIREIAGPEAAPIADFARRWLSATDDERQVMADPTLGYFGAPLGERTLCAGPDARIMPTRFDAWVAGHAAA